MTPTPRPLLPPTGGRTLIHQRVGPTVLRSRYKLAVLTWAAAYVTITLILAVLGPGMARWPLPLRTLALSLLMVAAMTWILMPLLTRLFRRWLISESSR